MSDNSQSELDYARIFEESKYWMVKEILKEVARHGLPTNNHFYITFATDHDGVDIPNQLQEYYDKEMTIVIQNQFWNLTVEDEGFSVDLNFSKQKESLYIPFRALISFSDPHAHVGFVFDMDIDEDEADEDSIIKEDETSSSALLQEVCDRDSPDDGENIKYFKPKGEGASTSDHSQKKAKGTAGKKSKAKTSLKGKKTPLKKVSKKDGETSGTNANKDNIVSLDKFRKS